MASLYDRAGGLSARSFRASTTYTDAMTVTGFASPEFSSVAERFREFADAQPEGGLALAVCVEGETVVDLIAGEAREGEPWTAETVSPVFSCTKGLSAVLVAQQVERGVIDPEAPVATWWPEFASVSASLTVRQLLEHRAGLAAVRRDLTLDEVLNHDTLIAELLRQGPLWEPGVGHEYHSFTFGTLIDELLRRATGTTVRELFQENIAGPLGVDAWIGIPVSVEPRVAQLIPAGSFVPPPAQPGSPEDLSNRALSFGTAFPMSDALEPNRGFNSQRVHEASLPGVNLITSARALAEMWSATVVPTRGVRLVSDDTVALMNERTVVETPLWGTVGPFNRRGFGVMLENPEITPLMSASSFGHDGFGGQAGYADPHYRSSIAFATNYLVPGVQQHARWHALMRETRAALEARAQRAN